MRGSRPYWQRSEFWQRRSAELQHTAPPQFRGPQGTVYGYEVNLASISVAEENIFYNYEEHEPAQVVFHLSNGNSLTLYFPESGACYLLPDAQGRSFSTPTTFRNQFNCPIGFVPILGPVEHHEPLYEKEAARLALFNYRAARNFRNIWYHYKERFPEFREVLQQTWPGMDVEPPEVDRSHKKPLLHMYCPEKRHPRELFLGWIWVPGVVPDADPHHSMERGIDLFD